MPTHIEKHRWRMAIACEIAGADQEVVRAWRKHDGLKIGKFEAGGYRFSVLDIAELALLPPLRKLNIAPKSAIEIARGERGQLRDGLNNRLVFGFWSLGAFELDDQEVGPNGIAKRVLYFDQILDRVIRKLELPLPSPQPLPRPSDAVRMVDAIFEYFYSPPGLLRWQRWRISVLERGGIIPFAQAAVELGAPEWFLRAVLRADARDNLIQIVAPHVPAVIERLEGVTLN